MNEHKESSELPCLWKKTGQCDTCGLNHKIHCHLEGKTTAKFGIPTILAFLPALIGTIRLGSPLGWINGGLWLGYTIFFFLIWEPPVLCAHCPFYAEPDKKILHCSINYGFFKTSRFKPYPMSTSEKAQFIIGALILFLFPVPLLMFNGEWILGTIHLLIFFPGVYYVSRNVCTECINISCPMNRLPLEQRRKFLSLNPEMEKNYQEYI